MAVGKGVPPPERGSNGEASEKTPLEADQKKEAEDRSGPESLVLYQAMLLKGEHELGRPSGSLFWSALAAGLAISTSLIAEGALYQRLPDAPWRALIVGFGYSVGFLIVILGRLQLFTEHTVVAVMPAVASPSKHNFRELMRLWGLVFFANQIGVFIAALSFWQFGLTSEPLAAAMIDVSHHMPGRSFGETLLQAIPAGFIIAAIAWVIVASKGEHFWLITLLTYLIAIGGFPHVIASGAAAYMLALSGEATFGWAVFGFVLPTLVGNVAGGSGLFAVLTFAQIREEI